MAAIRSEGGLLPADVLARISALDRELRGLGAPAFHLAPNERIGEAVARSWARLSAAWEAFSSDRDLMAADNHSSKATRERWLLPLFSELGYGRLIQQPAVEVDGKSYSVFCEYNHSPVHLVGAGVSLDRRTAGVRGAAEQSPHSLVQELLNRSTERLWGIVTNGLSLRLLRDNLTLTRQAYVEFDLEMIFATEAYEEFALLWLCAHQSRIEAEVPEECWLEQWTQAAQRDGTRALGELRRGVESAIEALGRGFLAQPANTALHTALRDGTLDGLAYYRELLRLIYRLLFLFVAEDRDALLLPDDATPARHDARQRYDAYYGTKRLRRLAVRRRGGRAHDLYEQFKLLSGWLREGGQPILALPPLGSALWSPSTTAHLSDARLGNEALLAAIRELAYVEGGRRPVDFRNLGAEELGSVYESLLELQPEIDRETASFALTTVAGHERKQTGSYYTPTSLIGSLLETALDPVIDSAVAAADPEQALLDLTVCDPACGSGHFLIAAANRIAKRLAAVREHDPEPAPELIRHALRDVVSRCIHGVDVNPMAVELCKVSLWLEALEPGRPLSFLDDRILCGNSLFGATPALIESGVPDDAFKPLLGDDKDTVKDWKRRNAHERRSGQTAIALGSLAKDAWTLSKAAIAVNALDDDSPEAVRQRETAFAELMSSAARDRLRLAADAWLAAFVAPRPARAEEPSESAFTRRIETGTPRISTDVVSRAASSGSEGLSEHELEAVRAQRDRHAPLHWHVAFPAVFRAGDDDAGEHGWAGGFDCVLGNPPWEHTELKEKEFFASRAPGISEAPTGAKRKHLIDALRVDDPALYGKFVAAKRLADEVSHLARMTGRYPLCGRGRINTYAVFAEGMRAMVGPTGRLGVIVPTGIATDDTTKLFFADLVHSRSLISLYDFRTGSGLWPDIGHQRFRFCLLTVAGTSLSRSHQPEFAFLLLSVPELDDSDRRFELTAEEIELLNPNTRTCPIFRTRRDAEIIKGIYRRVPVLLNEGPEGGDRWSFRDRRIFNLGTPEDVEAFADEPTAGLPHYDMGMYHQFDHRYGTYERGTRRRVLVEERTVDFEPLPRDWGLASEAVSRLSAFTRSDWLLVWRDYCRNTDERTCIATVLPPAATDFGTRVAAIEPIEGAAFFLAALNSFVFDFTARNALSGTHLSSYVIKQLPLPPPDWRCPFTGDKLSQSSFFRDRVVRLICTSQSVLGFARVVGGGVAAWAWDQELRDRDKAELDAAIGLLYGLERAELDYILDTFPIVRRKDEAQSGEYHTKRLVLEAYDQLAAVLSRTDDGVVTASS